jgi:A/G-specific adenine glycosylase
MNALLGPLLAWYGDAARDLPWRRPGASPWSVMVSELMLQQTPVVRVLPVHARWLERWPTPAALAAEPSGEAVRAWGRLGYPRRALWLHAAAVTITERHDGQVPSSLAELRALPGVGEYTAAAIASFGYGGRHAVLDTNVRRVLARAVTGVERPGPSLVRAERLLAEELLPAERLAARWSVAVMELGALVCTSAEPSCGTCPIADRCAWKRAGRPPYRGRPRRSQGYAGTDRQCRGRLLAVLRDADQPVALARLELEWHRVEQVHRCVQGLLVDGLADEISPGRYALPG